MDTYQIVLNAVFFLAGCGLAAWLVPWLIDRRAYKDGFHDGWRAHRDAVEEESAFGPPVDLSERIRHYGSHGQLMTPDSVLPTADPQPYMSRVDPDNASY